MHVTTEQVSKTTIVVWECGSVTECLPSVCEALGSIPQYHIHGNRWKWHSGSSGRALALSTERLEDRAQAPSSRLRTKKKKNPKPNQKPKPNTWLSSVVECTVTPSPLSGRMDRGGGGSKPRSARLVSATPQPLPTPCKVIEILLCLDCLLTVFLPVAKYKLRIVEPPVLPLDKKYKADEDDPDIEPNLWMWVDPNVVYPPGKMQVKEAKWARPPSPPLSSQPSVKEEGSCSEGAEEESPQPSSGLGSPPEEQKPSQVVVPLPCPWQLAEEEAAQDQDDSSSVALPSPPTRAPLQSRRLRQPISSEGRLWSRPPLNYFHLIALALRNSPHCGLNVQQIYSFTRRLPKAGRIPSGTTCVSETALRKCPSP
ncbi:forkhead box protein R1 isoform 3-T3 [Thomomys bottae]